MTPSEALRRARDHEESFGPGIPEEERPAFHAAAPVGWMNDPNGFSYYKGECHLFYQYHPYSVQWGPMHWGHLKTSDFIRWRRLPAALAPDEEYDAAGCFSGGAVELADGRQLLMYTGVRRRPGPDGREEELQTQCIAIGDGVDYQKLASNPVLEEKDLPEGGSPVDFRDPKVWRAADGSLYAVVGNRAADGSGAVLLYHGGADAPWRLVRVLDACRNRYGRMWECPDFFPLDGHQLLLVSPQEMAPEGLEFHPGYGALCLMGDYDPEGAGFTRRKVQAIDHGIDFYAPQTLEAPDGRRIMVAWMQNWAAANATPPGCRWFGQMTLPRELSVRDGHLYQVPVRELARCRSHPVVLRSVPVSGEISLPGVKGRLVDMTVTVRPSGDGYRWFRIRVAKDDRHETILRYRPEEGILKLDRSRSGLRHDILHTRSFFVRPREGELTLRIILDRFSLEVFVNDGEQAASATLYTPQQADAITFEAGGAALLDLEKYDLTLDREP